MAAGAPGLRRLTGSRTRLAVLGSPIAHSRSPLLHEAAYRVLGVPWTYEAIEVKQGDLAGFVESMGDEWRGLSLTMPLKRDVLPLLDRRDDLVDLTGGANTALFTADGIAGFNTDVYGVTQALRRAGVHYVTTVRLLGAGATAASVLVAVASLGAATVAVSTRTPERALSLVGLADTLGIDLTISGLANQQSSSEPDLVVSTLPGGAVVDVAFPNDVLTGATLFDVAYDPWPSPIASRWLASGGRVVSGFDMLIHQAVAQVRIFVSGNPDEALEDEPQVVEAMRASLGLGPE